MDTYFSDRHGIHRPATGLIRRSVPELARNALLIAVNRIGGYDIWDPIWNTVNEEVLVQSSGNTDNWYAAKGNITWLIRNREWNFVLDTCQVIYRTLREHESKRPAEGITAAEFSNRVNGAFVRFYVGYSMDESGHIIETGAAVADATVAEARALLRNPILSGPDRDFQRALEAFGRRPSPDYEGTVPAAINAVEGVARIALGTKDTLGDAIKLIGKSRNLHPDLVGSIDRLYRYTSDEGGRHGLVGEPKVDRAIAEFCLHQSAAAIVLIARLYGYEVVEGPAG